MSGSSGPVQVRPSVRVVRVLYYAAFIALALVLGWVNNKPEDERQFWLVIFPALFLIWVFTRHLKQRVHVLTIGGGKLRYESGFLSKTTRTMDLAKIQDVRVDQSVWHRMIGVGDISIETAGETGGLSMKNIDSPHRVAEYILEAAGK